MRVFKKRIAFSIVLVVTLLSIGTMYYQLAEGWTPVDSFYFSTMTLTTIGYGDLAPTTEGAKIFTSFYAIFGIGIMLYILSSVIGVLVFSQERYFTRAFSFIGKIGRQQKDIKELEKRIGKEREKEITDLRKQIEQKRKEDIREVKEKIEQKDRDIKNVEKQVERKSEKGIREVKEKIEQKDRDIKNVEKQVERKSEKELKELRKQIEQKKIDIRKLEKRISARGR